MPREGDCDSFGFGKSHPALWEAKLTKVDARQIRVECYIPKNIKIRFDVKKRGDVVCSYCHEVCLYETMFRAGFCLPSLPMI